MPLPTAAQDRETMASHLETVVTPTNRGHYMVASNRQLRDVLLARGYDLTY